MEPASQLRHTSNPIELTELIAATIGQLNRVILGKQHQLRLCVACLLARGHLLIEDIPGVGKTRSEEHTSELQSQR